MTLKAMTIRARVIRRTDDEESAAPLLTVLFFDSGGINRVEKSIGSCDRFQFRDLGGGFQVGDEFDVMFTLRPKNTEQPPY